MQRTLRSLAYILVPAALMAALAGCGNVPSSNGAGGPQAVATPVVVTDPVDIYVAQSQAASGLNAVTVPGGVIYVQRIPVLTRADLTDAAAMIDQQGQHFVGLRFTDAGTRKLAAASSSNIGRMLALVVGRQLVASPRITEPLNRGVLAFGVPTQQAARDIAARIRGEETATQPTALPAVQ
ncbi:MAG: SecDF P1 head subdomain-containing protein [Bordetella sp.]|uniref:SecDF P1 head subdomain-containing protein n=1 Tax=Bordetella sp. TaxID=28081 RepID=UPI003F7CB38D